jgi:hypothetical protein
MASLLSSAAISYVFWINRKQLDHVSIILLIMSVMDFISTWNGLIWYIGTSYVACSLDFIQIQQFLRSVYIFIDSIPFVRLPFVEHNNS